MKRLFALLLVLLLGVGITEAAMRLNPITGELEYYEPSGLTDNSITPVMLQSSSGTPDSTTVYFGDGHWGLPSGGSMTYPGAGIPVSLGSSWSTSLAIPAGVLVGTTAAQAISNKSFGTGMTWPTFNQNTTGTAAGLSAQYVDWDASSGGTSIANKPSLGTMALGAYPGAGVPKSTGSAWDNSYTVGTGANNLVQLNASGQLPAVSAANLTNFPTLNQNTTGTASGLSGTPAIAVSTIDTGQGANEVYPMNQDVQTSAGVTFDNVTANEFISSAADNTHYINVANTADPATATDGDCQYNKTSNEFKCYSGSDWVNVGNPQDNSILVSWDNVTNTPTTAAGYGIVDAHTVNWGTSLAQPAAAAATPFQWSDAQYTIDNVALMILDNTAALVTAADNVTAQVLSCSAPGTCDNVIASTQVLGNAISYPSITSAVVHLKDWLMVKVTAVGRATTYLTFSVGVIAHATP